MAIDPIEQAHVAGVPGTETDNEDVREQLRILIQTNRDAAKGFSEAAEAMENPSHKSTFAEYAEQRRSFVQELLNVADRFGVGSEEDGSALGAVHRAWISVKAALTSGDHAILEAAEAGEDHAVKSYAEALQIELPADVDGPVRRQYTEVKAAHDKVRAMRDASI